MGLLDWTHSTVSCNMRSCTLSHVRQAKNEISLRICYHMCAQRKFRSACAFAQSDQNLRWALWIQPWLSGEHNAMNLIRLIWFFALRPRDKVHERTSRLQSNGNKVVILLTIGNTIYSIYSWSNVYIFLLLLSKVWTLSVREMWQFTKIYRNRNMWKFSVWYIRQDSN